MSLRTRWRPGDRYLVRHKDSSILVVEKKAGLLTVPRPSGRGADLMSLLEEFLGGRRRQPLVYAVHRIDRPVSGLLVVARTPEALERLRTQFEAHTVERRYLTAVQGNLQEDRGTFRSMLESDSALRMRSSDQGLLAITHWQVVERFDTANATLLEVTLETGRRNQIRAHFSEAGHPLLGERKYLDDSDGVQGVDRLFLHAAILGFDHPVTRDRLRFEAPLPPDLESWRRRLASARPGESLESRPRARRHPGRRR